MFIVTIDYTNKKYEEDGTEVYKINTNDYNQAKRAVEEAITTLNENDEEGYRYYFKSINHIDNVSEIQITE
jgi:hypothetical protein